VGPSILSETERVAGSTPAQSIRGEKRKMATTGTLNEVLEKVYDLYIEGRIEDISVKNYLAFLRDVNGERVFSDKDIDYLVDILRRDKQEADNYVLSPTPEDVKGEQENGGL